MVVVVICAVFAIIWRCEKVSHARGQAGARGDTAPGRRALHLLPASSASTSRYPDTLGWKYGTLSRATASQVLTNPDLHALPA